MGFEGPAIRFQGSTLKICAGIRSPNATIRSSFSQKEPKTYLFYQRSA